MKITLARSRATRAAVVTICVIVLLIQPLRSVWMSLVLPRPWADTDAVHLYKVLTHFQNIPLDKAPMRKMKSSDGSTSHHTQQLREFISGEQNVYPEFWSQYREVQMESEANKDDSKRQRAELIDMFKPLLNTTERARLLLAFETFHQACQKAGLTYFMIEASLMGVMRHHGLVPWDDDIDVAMSVKDWIRIRDVLGNIEGFELFAQKEKHWKFYSITGEPFEDAYFTFPYMDIFFYDEDDTHIWAVSKYLKHDLVFNKKDIFPLQYRPFQNHMVPVPCNLDAVVRNTHDMNICVTPAFVHKSNGHNTNDKILVQCKLLYDLYPFVFEVGDRSTGKVDEKLVVGRRVIHSMSIADGCPKIP